MKEKNGEHPLGDAGQIIIFLLFFFVWIVDSFFFKRTTILVSLLPLFLRLALLILTLVLAVYLSRNAHIVVSNHRKPSKVIETDSFKYVRHPIYLASLLVYFGLAISTMSLISFVVLILSFLFHNYIAGYEEKLLINKFGATYKDYMNRTGRWIPKRGRTLSK